MVKSLYYRRSPNTWWFYRVTKEQLDPEYKPGCAYPKCQVNTYGFCVNTTLRLLNLLDRGIKKRDIKRSINVTRRSFMK